jgi:hypothetical protein
MRKFLLLISLCFSVRALAQLTPDQAAKALDSFAFMNPQEKLFVHSDRDIFTAGETIWFKAYIALDGRPTNLSKVVYVELANSKGQLVAKRMLKADNGSAAGDITLNDSLPSGTYTLNAYTLWMLNFPQFIFKKHIAVYNADAAKKKTATPTGDFTVQLLPEGGSLVAGLESRVAFKAVDATGLPLNIQGNVVDGKKNAVATLTAAHDGMGTFTFTPKPGETYTAVCTAPGGRAKSFPLPAAMPEGIVMTVNNDNPNRLFVQFSRAEANKAKYNELLVIAQMNYEVVYTGKVDFDAEMTAAAINKKNLPAGILQITAMSMNAVPLAERLVFVNNLQLPQQQLSPDTVNTAKRKRNHFTIDLSSFQDITASAAVVNADAGASLSGADNIVSSLLLTGDLKGYVHDPSFYFRNKDTPTTRALDLLLMTQGWRRFNWENIVKYNHPKLRFPFETGISVKGKLAGANGRSAVPNGKIELITKAEDSTTILSTATVNASNEFAVFDLNFWKGATVYYQGTNANRQEALVNVTMYPSYFDTLTAAKALPETDRYAAAAQGDYWNALLQEKLQADSAQGKTLAAVTVTGRKRTPLDSLNRAYATEIFYNSDQTLPLDSDAYFIDIWQFLGRSVPGIAISNTDTGKRVYFTRYAGVDVFSEAGGSSVQFFLNEVPVSIDIIDALSPTDIALVKIFKGNTAIVLGADRGAIAVYTRKGTSGRDWRKRGFDAFRLSGYAVSREFYHPVHTVASQMPDRRPTLYWNPHLIKGANGKAVISFYNDDVAKKFKVVVQGIDKDGKLLSIEQVVQ